MSNERKININLLDDISFEDAGSKDDKSSDFEGYEFDEDIETANDFDDLDDIDLDTIDINNIGSGKNPDSNSDQNAPVNKTNNKKKKKQATVASEILSYVKVIIVAVIIALVVNRFIIVNAQVPTGSMISTININDRLIGFRLAYLFSEPQRGDIVVFKYPDNEEEEYVKRIIGTPGDVVQIKEGHVYVNGELLNEDYINEPMIPTAEEQVYVVPAGHYFMLGDNRNNSKDSRYWDNTYVAKDKIVAKVIFRYYKGNSEDNSFSFKNISFSFIK